MLGKFIQSYAEKLAPKLSNPSAHVLGDRYDTPEIMRRSNVLALPPIEEWGTMVTAGSRASSFILGVSDAAGANCIRPGNELAHCVGDVYILTKYFRMLHQNRDLLERLQATSQGS